MLTNAELLKIAQDSLREAETLRKRVGAAELMNAELMKVNQELKEKSTANMHELEALKQKIASKKKSRKHPKATVQPPVASENEAKHSEDTVDIEPQATVMETSVTVEDAIVETTDSLPEATASVSDTLSMDPALTAPIVKDTTPDTNDDAASADSRTEGDAHTSASTTTSGPPTPKKAAKKKNSKKGKAAKKASTPPPAPQSTEPSAPIEDSLQKKRLEMDSNERKMDRRQRMKEMKAQREKFDNDVGALRFLMQVAQSRNHCELSHHCDPSNCDEHPAGVGADSSQASASETAPTVQPCC